MNNSSKPSFNSTLMTETNIDLIKAKFISEVTKFYEELNKRESIITHLQRQNSKLEIQVDNLNKVINLKENTILENKKEYEEHIYDVYSEKNDLQTLLSGSEKNVIDLNKTIAQLEDEIAHRDTLINLEKNKLTQSENTIKHLYLNFEDYKEIINKKDSELSTLNANIDELHKLSNDKNNKIQDFEKTIDDLKTQISNLENDKKAVLQQIDSLKEINEQKADEVKKAYTSSESFEQEIYRLKLEINDFKKIIDQKNYELSSHKTIVDEIKKTHEINLQRLINNNEAIDKEKNLEYENRIQSLITKYEIQLAEVKTNFDTQVAFNKHNYQKEIDSLNSENKKTIDRIVQQYELKIKNFIESRETFQNEIKSQYENIEASIRLSHSRNMQDLIQKYEEQINLITQNQDVNTQIVSKNYQTVIDKQKVQFESQIKETINQYERQIEELKQKMEIETESLKLQLNNYSSSVTSEDHLKKHLAHEIEEKKITIAQYELENTSLQQKITDFEKWKMRKSIQIRKALIRYKKRTSLLNKENAQYIIELSHLRKLGSKLAEHNQKISRDLEDSLKQLNRHQQQTMNMLHHISFLQVSLEVEEMIKTPIKIDDQAS